MSTLQKGAGLPVAPQLDPQQQFTLKNLATNTCPADGIAFYTSSVAGGVAVPIGSVLTDVATYTVKEGQRGFLKFIGMNVIPGGSFGDVSWQLVQNGVPNPNFGTLSFLSVATNTLSNLIPFQVAVNPLDTIVIRARNSGLGAVTCFAVLDGWTFPIKRV